MAELTSFPWEWIGSVPLSYLKNLTEVGPDFYFERQGGEGWEAASTMGLSSRNADGYATLPLLQKELHFLSVLCLINPRERLTM